MSILGRASKIFRRLVASANQPLYEILERQLLLQAASEAKRNRMIGRISALHQVEFHAFSQWGEDGIIDWLVERIGDLPNTFVEFGVSDYRESNTRLLLQLRNWRGLVIDGSEANIKDIRAQNIFWRHDFEAKQAFITKDNINDLIANSPISGEIGLLSIDVDGNDYWVWKEISDVNPVIVVCEFNSVFGDKHAITIPYDPTFVRSQAHYSNLHFGASLPSLVNLAEFKGYTFVGTTSSGCNAFFVRKDKAAVIEDFIEQIWAFPTVARESRDAAGILDFISGPARSNVISEQSVVDLDAGPNKIVQLAEKRDLYSREWANGQGRIW